MPYKPAELLEQMVRIPSLSGQEGELAQFLCAAMSDMGYRSHVDAAGNAVGEIGSGSRQIVMLGHMDTVPGVVPVRRDGDLLYGRGAVDAKGPLAAFVCAAAQVRVPADWRVAVIGAVEEEAATSKGARYVLPLYHPEAVIIGEPSSWGRVTVGYKGRLLIEYTGAREAAHSARIEEGVCEQAVAFWCWVKNFCLAFNTDREGQFDKVDCALRRINSESNGLIEQVKMEIALRLPTGFDAERFMSAATTTAVPAKIEFNGYECAYRAGKNTALVRALLSGIRKGGGQPRFSVKTGTSDMNVVGPVWGCPIAAYGPGDSDLDHTPNEHISLTEYEHSIAVLALSLQELLR